MAYGMAWHGKQTTFIAAQSLKKKKKKGGGITSKVKQMKKTMNGMERHDIASHRKKNDAYSDKRTVLLLCHESHGMESNLI